MVTGNTMCPIRMNFKLGRGIQLSGTAVGWSAQEPGTTKLKLDWPVFEPRFHPFSNCVSLVLLCLNFLICKIWGQYQKSPRRANNVCKILRIWSRAFTRYEPIDRGKKDRGWRGVGIGYNYQRSHNPQCIQLLSGSTVGLLGGGLEMRF